jgi:hypothetical protein
VASDDPMAGKVSFDDIYDQPDPRAYFRTLAALEYRIPELARGPFAHLARTLRGGSERCRVLDLCCSYGINAALLNHDVTLDELYARYRAAELDALPSDELVAADRHFYARRRRRDAVPVVGLDAAAKAVGYALGAGLLEAGSSENLEEADPSDDLRGRLAGVRLITVTGGIGYVTERTFAHLRRAHRLHDFGYRRSEFGGHAKTQSGRPVPACVARSTRLSSSSFAVNHSRPSEIAHRYLRCPPTVSIRSTTPVHGPLSVRRSESNSTWSLTIITHLR